MKQNHNSFKFLATLENQIAYYKDTKAKMEAHIADLKSQLAQITSELERLNNEELFCTEELQEVTQKLAERTELNNKRVAEMTKKLEKVLIFCDICMTKM